MAVVAVAAGDGDAGGGDESPLNQQLQSRRRQCCLLLVHFGLSLLDDDDRAGVAQSLPQVADRLLLSADRLRAIGDCVSVLLLLLCEASQVANLEDRLRRLVAVVADLHYPSLLLLLPADRREMGDEDQRAIEGVAVDAGGGRRLLQLLQPSLLLQPILRQLLPTESTTDNVDDVGEEEEGGDGGGQWARCCSSRAVR